MHFQHLSCAESVLALAQAQGSGRSGSPARSTPHHLTLTDEAVLSLDSRFKMNPPLRTEADRRALIDGLNSGVIDCIATDHAPHAPHEKEVPFEQAPMGTTGLETAFASLYTELVLPGELELAIAGRSGSPPAALCTGCRCRGSPPASRRTSCLVDLDAGFEVGAEGYVEPLGELLLPRAHAARRVLLTRRRRRVAFARVASGGRSRRDRRERCDRDGYVLLEDGARFDGLACGADGRRSARSCSRPRCRATRRR